MSQNQPERETLEAAALKIVRVLQEAGHVAYFAGGCVRDRLLGVEPKDYDVATDARPEEVVGLFHRAYMVGEAFGVVLVRLMGCGIEVATFRAEWGYADGRHPDHVEYTNAERDALRRDFTINGLFYDPLADRVIDYVGGREDLRRRVIRAIGKADERFAEDYLRMLRAVRFAARLGFGLEESTAAAIRAHASKLDRISRERIGLELRMMLEHASRAKAAGMLQGLGLDGPVLREEVGRTEEPVCLEGLAGKGVDYATALAGWALDRRVKHPRPMDRSGVIEAVEGVKVERLVRGWRKALVLSNAHRDLLGDLLRALPEALRWPELGVAAKKRLLALGWWGELERLMLAADRLHGGAMLDREALVAEVGMLREEGVAPEPLVTGDDLIRAGLKPGPAFKRILDRVYDAQLTGEVATAEAGLELARALAAR